MADLLDVVRLQNGKLTLALTPLALDAVVEQAAEVGRQMTDLPIHLELAADDPRVNGDAGRLEQVLLNLLINAITHARGTDRIDVRLRREETNAVLEVQDYGSGIAPGDLPNLFSRFFQVVRVSADTTRGLGLGLYIVRELVTAHGGTIEVLSSEGQGSTFTIRLPLLSSQPA